MKNNYLQKICFFFFLMIAITLTGTSQTHHSDFQDGKIYLKYKDSYPVSFSVLPDNDVNFSTIPQIQSISDAYSIRKVSRPYDFNNDSKLLRTLLIEFDKFELVEDLIAELKEDSTVEYVEKVPLDKVNFTPNDSLYLLYNGPRNWNWHLELIKADQAWDITTGNSDIVVAIVDNAVWVDHPDLSSKVVLQRDVYYNDNDANPPTTGDAGEWSHGTHVAGLVGAATNNMIGVASIGYNVSLMAIRASNNSSPRTLSAAYPGIQWAAQNGADIINMSWGSNQFSQTNLNVINSIASQGIVMVAAAGNDNVSTLHYPSAYPNVISVASVDWNDVKSNFSNYSNTVDVSSPGGFASPGPAGLLSTTYSTGDLGYYDSFYGTSMASPVVAGLTALILSINPDLTPTQVEEILKTTSDDISVQNPDYIGLLGVGRINALGAVSSTPYTPTAQFSTPVREIMPGSSIDYHDLSTGIPSEWEWNFEGAVPQVVLDTNPSQILYPEEGTFDVTLTVNNEWGSSTVTINDYIHVTSSPAPYVFIRVSDSLPCIAETIMLIDSSLYNPDTWSWSIEPATFEFVNGTNANSQNPEISFLRQGWYDIIASVSNQNGITTQRFDKAVHVQGVTPPYILDMENGTSEYFILWDTIKSQSGVDLRAANNSMYGIHFHGDPIPTGWKGGPETGTPEEAWIENRQFVSEAHICGVDARSFTNIKLAFDLRQTYSLGSRFSWFRVLVNGQPVADYNGIANFNPITASEDPWQRIEYDLSSYAGDLFDITLQACNRFSDKSEGEGDNVFIDNIEIVNSVNRQDIVAGTLMKIFPNPTSGSFVIKADGIKSPSLIEISDLGGRIIRSFQIHTNTEFSVDASNLNSGLYIVRMLSNNEVITGKLLVGEKK
jgi:subtilisin family serine protease